MALIIFVMCIIYFILIAWAWQNLGKINKSRKIVFLIVGNLIIYLVTFIIFGISKSGITYQNSEIQKIIQNILVTLFTGINGIFLLPYIAKIFKKVYEKDLKKEQAIKRFLIISIVCLIIFIFECGYLKDIQKGILKFYLANIN